MMLVEDKRELISNPTFKGGWEMAAQGPMARARTPSPGPHIIRLMRCSIFS